jgi:hypothetical protein
MLIRPRQKSTQNASDREPVFIRGVICFANFYSNCMGLRARNFRVPIETRQNAVLRGTAPACGRTVHRDEQMMCRACVHPSVIKSSGSAEAAAS